MEVKNCPKCGNKLGKSGKCVLCRNEKILEACINHSKNIKNHTTTIEFENSKYMKKVWKESGLARIYNPILIILKKEVEAGIYSKEVVDGKHYFSLVGTPIVEEDEVLEEEDDFLLLKEGEEGEEPEEEEPEEEEPEEEETEEEPEEEEEEEEDDEKLAIKQYEKETGNKVITTRGNIRQDFLKWKKTNWD